jgi:hypothetical protein
MGPLLLCRLFGQFRILRRNQWELEVREMVIHVEKRRCRLLWGVACRRDGRLLCMGWLGMWGGVIDAQIRRFEPDLEEICSVGEMQGACLRGEAGAVLEQVGDVL